jgi:hypothetical protein
MVFKKGDKVLIKAVRAGYQKDLPFIGRIGVIIETTEGHVLPNKPMDGEQDYMVKVKIGPFSNAYVWADVCEVTEIFEVLEGL